MRSIYLTLAWKELHEQAWAVLAAIAIALLFPLAIFLYDARIGWESILGVLIFYPFVGGCLFGMRAAAGERAHRTASLMSALPVKAHVLGRTKLMAAIVGALIPLLVLTILGLLVLGLNSYAPTVGGIAGAVVDGSPPRFHALISVGTIAGIIAAITVHVLLVVAVFGLGQASEIQAALRGVLALAIWGAAALYVFFYWPQNQLVQCIRWLGPPWEWLFAFLGEGPRIAQLAGPPAFLVAASMLMLAFVFVTNYARAIRPLQDTRVWRIGGWLPERIRSPLAALFWKQVAETIPMSLAVLGSAAIFSLLFGWEMNKEMTLLRRSHDLLAMFLGTVSVVGFLLALLIGVGTFAPDLEPRVNTFWRSRPISASAWFWSKYWVGVLAMLLTLGLPAVASGYWLYGRNLGEIGEWIEFIYTMIVWLMMWLLAFSVAVATTCLVRHTLYASILTVGVVLFYFTAIFASTTGLPPSNEYVVVTLIGGILIATALGRWFAVRDLVAYPT